MHIYPPTPPHTHRATLTEIKENGGQTGNWCLDKAVLLHDPGPQASGSLQALGPAQHHSRGITSKEMEVGCSLKRTVVMSRPNLRAGLARESRFRCGRLSTRRSIINAWPGPQHHKPIPQAPPPRTFVRYPSPSVSNVSNSRRTPSSVIRSSADSSGTAEGGRARACPIKFCAAESTMASRTAAEGWSRPGGGGGGLGGARERGGDGPTNQANLRVRNLKNGTSVRRR